ncbi:MAG: RtcB family protein [Deltaproteobacteria bacterium]|jgi:RNA-splicing ligase RtcB|nr:RtcB family protein [Deltaproteobacteria bacterium]
MNGTTTVTGMNNQAVVFTDRLEESATRQLVALCDSEDFSGSTIRVMPDVHAGAGCGVVGLTMTLDGKVDPDMVGVDIGCGMLTTRIKDREIDFQKLDYAIRRLIPSGFNVRDTPCESPLRDELGLDRLKCVGSISLKHAELSLGTLGGGNHFIEVERDSEGRHLLVIHSGSRKLGLNVAGFYSKKAAGKVARERKAERYSVIAGLKAKGLEREIADTLKRMPPTADEGIPFVSGKDFEDYIHDMTIAQRYAGRNRMLMADIILKAMDWDVEGRFETVHNYIDTGSMILRKGAVSANRGQLLLVPINMRDGSLLCRGLGNEDWNRSAPHGAGRLMSRREARQRLSVKDYVDGMKGVWTTSAGTDTLDEAPGAYKDIDDIIFNIGPTAEIVDRLMPVYNFKAPGGPRMWS